MAPEVITGKEYDHKADVWSLGCMFFELLTGFMPFLASDLEDLRKNLIKGSYSIPKTVKLSLEGASFLNKCL